MQDISEIYHQGHGTRCRLNGCPQYHNQERHRFKFLTWTLRNYSIVQQKSWEQTEWVFIHFSVREIVPKAWIFRAALFASDSRDADRIPRGPLRENKLWIWRQFASTPKFINIFPTPKATISFPRIKTLELSDITLLGSTHKTVKALNQMYLTMTHLKHSWSQMNTCVCVCVSVKDLRMRVHTHTGSDSSLKMISGKLMISEMHGDK